MIAVYVICVYYIVYGWNLHSYSWQWPAYCHKCMSSGVEQEEVLSWLFHMMASIVSQSPFHYVNSMDISVSGPHYYHHFLDWND